jgi:LuxR family maltose regulon positive regulatory protein
MSEPEFILKSTPPRLPRTALQRDRLSLVWAEIRDRTAISVVAPKGFGKTTLLLQWRRLWLEQGAFVAWLGVDTLDEPSRFTMALLHSLRNASGRPAFATIAARHAGQRDEDQIAALTSLLSEIASLGLETVLMIDDAERLPEASAARSLAYLMHNAPQNLHIVIGSRIALTMPTWDLSAKGNFALLKTDELRLQLEESVAILDKRFGKRLSLDDRVRLHETTEGWPIGLQLAAAAIEREPNVSLAAQTLSARHGDIEDYFMQSLFLRLPPAVADFLTHTAILDHLNADVCLAVSGNPSSAQFLEQLMFDSPIVMVAELKDWVRLHPLARDFLLGRFEQLPAAERTALHARASQWFAERERFHDAAGHALAAGDEELAHSYALRCLWTLGAQGKLAEARIWLERMPVELFAKDVSLRLVGAWIIAFSDRNAEALQIARTVLDDPGAGLQSVVIATRVAAGAAGFADRVGLIPRLLGRWTDFQQNTDIATYEDTFPNAFAVMALHRGDTEKSRQLAARSLVLGSVSSIGLVSAVGQVLIGLTHLWDGDAYKAESALRPALLQAESAMGRRSIIAGLFAATLAAAMLERDELEAAQALLANRLDVIEGGGLPDAILLAYRTLAYVALAQGDERRALNLFESLHALAEARRLPRLMLHCLAEQIRVHSLRACTETVGKLVQTLDQLAAAFTEEEFSPFRSQYELAAAIAKTYAALAHHDLDAAEHQLVVADALASQMHRGRDALTVKVLRAVVARKRHAAHALPLLAEALSLAAIGGHARLLADTHPLAVEMGAELRVAAVSAKTAGAIRLEAEPTGAGSRAQVAPSGLLTPKEAEILGLLSNGMSNKLIARAMEISDETVKWHLKNLFAKLSAGTRKHAVGRARLLGLITG